MSFSDQREGECEIKENDIICYLGTVRCGFVFVAVLFHRGLVVGSALCGNEIKVRIQVWSTQSTKQHVQKNTIILLAPLYPPAPLAAPTNHPTRARATTNPALPAQGQFQSTWARATTNPIPSAKTMRSGLEDMMEQVRRLFCFVDLTAILNFFSSKQCATITLRPRITNSAN